MNRADLKKTWRAAAIISAGIISAVFVYAVVIEVVRRLPGFAPPLKGAGAAAAMYALYVLGAAGPFSLKFIRPRFETPKPSPDGTAKAMLAFSVIAAALCETPALTGFVLFLLTGRCLDFYLLTFFSVIMELVYFPRYDRWEEKLRGAHGLTFD